jgi:hypothetical protein
MIMKRIAGTLTFLIVLLHAVTAAAQQAPVSEYQVKAAFLYNFAKFVEWPDYAAISNRREFIIGIIGEDPFGPDISVIEGKYVNDKLLRVVRSDSLSELNNCHVLFISGSAASRLTEILGKLDRRPVLTVGDTHGFAYMGVMINLIRKDNKVRFEINQSAADRAGLRISSHLLRLAKIIDPAEGQP